jgi:hypothetical protein
MQDWATHGTGQRLSSVVRLNSRASWICDPERFASPKGEAPSGAEGEKSRFLLVSKRTRIPRGARDDKRKRRDQSERLNQRLISSFACKRFT